MKIRRKYLILFLIMSLLLISRVSLGKSADKGDIYVLPVKGDITRASFKFIEKNIKEIEGQEPAGIIFEIDTYGGLVDEAINIKDLILSLDIPTVSYINNKAESAGVLISIASEHVVMSETATIGSAETIPPTEKILSMWRSVLRDTAQHRGRNPEIIEAMADKDIAIEGLVDKGKLLNLTSREALEEGISDLSSNNYDKIIEKFKLGSGNVLKIDESWAIKLSKYISSPYFSSLLLTLGFLGIVVEVLTAGFGIGTSISVLAFGLYFGGNIMAGYANLTTLIIFITGILLLLIELVVPGFGLPGISGIILVTTGAVLATNSLALSVTSLLVALTVAVVVGFLLVRFGFKSKSMSKVVLNKKLDSEGKFLSTDSKDEYLNLEGIATTGLRPSGFAEINGEKLDVLSEGGFIEKGEKIKVVRVEGSKIFVRGI